MVPFHTLAAGLFADPNFALMLQYPGRGGLRLVGLLLIILLILAIIYFAKRVVR